VIPLSAALARAAVPRGEWRWPLGEIDKPFQMRRDSLVFDARSSAGNLVIHVGRSQGNRLRCKRSSCRRQACIRRVR